MNEKIKDGGPAFPVPMVMHNGDLIDVQYGGMALRDWFAGMALQGILTRYGFDAPISHRNNETPPLDASRVCFEYADAMLAEREKGKL